jgi:predicted enzyme related to lactoylglutathione lyase
MAAKKAKKAPAAKAKKTAAKKAPAAKKAKKTAAAKKAPAKAKKTAPARKAAGRKARAAIPIVHWEIQARNADALHGFYRDLFGWTIDANNEMKYGMVESAGKGGINGGIGGSPDSTSRVVVYAQVKDINDTLEKVESLGGKTVMPRTDIGVVIMALFQDPDGNTFGVIEG